MKRLLFPLLTLQAFLLETGLHAQGEEGPPGDQGMYQTLIMIAIALLFFYFILWRPEQKRRRALEEQRASLKKGDRVTAMGIIGTISNIQENTVILRMYDGAKIEVLKGAITDMAPGEEEGKKEQVDLAKTD